MRALQAMLLDLEDHIGKVDLGANPEEGKAFPGEFIYELFGRASLCFDSADMVSEAQSKVPNSLSLSCLLFLSFSQRARMIYFFRFVCPSPPPFHVHLYASWLVR